MEWYVIAILLAVGLVALLLMGVPIAVALAGVSIVFMLPVLGMKHAFLITMQEITHFWSGYEILAVPLFVLMGELLLVGGYAERLFDMASKWLNRVPGGLSVVTIATCGMFGALSGSAIAATATMGRLAIPEMVKKGYSKSLAGGSVAAAGSLAHLIPPSVLLVLYAMLVEVSAAETLMAGLVPGIILTLGYAVVAMVWALVKPSAAPREPSVSWQERLATLKAVIAPLILALIMLGVIYFGIATVTEAAAIGAGATLAMVVITRRGFNLRHLADSSLAVVTTTSFILLMAVGGKILSWVLSYYLIPQHILDALFALELNPYLVIVMIQLLWFVLGMFIDPLGMMYITVPLVVPILMGYDFSLVWFGILMAINMEVANVTPPLGLALYVVKGVAPKDFTISMIFKGYLPFSIADISCLGLVIAFPALALWLPGTM